MTSESQKIIHPTVKDVTLDDLRHALSRGVSDYFAAPHFGLFFGGVFAVGGLFLTWVIFKAGMPWLAYPMVVGFSLVGPFIAAGLYEVSRNLEIGTRPTWRQVLGVIWDQRSREFGWMAFVTLFIFWVWIYQVRTLVAVFFGSSGFASLEALLEAVFTTQNGLIFLLTGHIVGAVISLVLFALTVMSCPLLLDRDVDFVTAMVTSIRAVFTSPVTMFCWGVFVILSILLSAATAFLGLLIVLPILGHATWHLYRRAISWDS